MGGWCLTWRRCGDWCGGGSDGTTESEDEVESEGVQCRNSNERRVRTRAGKYGVGTKLKKWKRPISY